MLTPLMEVLSNPDRQWLSGTVNLVMGPVPRCGGAHSIVFRAIRVGSRSRSDSQLETKGFHTSHSRVDSRLNRNQRLPGLHLVSQQVAPRHTLVSHDRYIEQAIRL